LIEIPIENWLEWQNIKPPEIILFKDDFSQF
jgi:hypothetical protein